MRVQNKSPRRATLRDVAAAAGVSVQTVSNAANGRHHLMSAVTLARVQEAMVTLNYRPNAIARGLRCSRTETLAFLIHESGERVLAGPGVDLLLAGAQSQAAECGYALTVRAGDVECAPDAGLLRPLVEHRADGAILLAGGDVAVRRSLEEHVAGLSYPFVTFEEDADPEGGVTVTAGNRAAAKEVAEHLIGRGHERIAWVAGHMPRPLIEARLRGFRDALAAHGRTLAPELERFDGGWDPASGTEAATALLDLAEPPTAVMAANDQLAIGVMRALRERGLRIPEDVAVTGFGDYEFAAFLDPPLTTASVPLFEMGQAAAELLIDLIEEREATSRAFPVRVQLRGSS